MRARGAVDAVRIGLCDRLRDGERAADLHDPEASVKGVAPPVVSSMAKPRRAAWLDRGIQLGDVQDPGCVFFSMWFGDPDGNLWTLQGAGPRSPQKKRPSKL